MKGQGSDPNMLMAQYLEKGWRKRLTYKWSPIGNGLLWIKWSCYRLA